MSSIPALGLDSKLWIEIMGSYRRGQESSGDVDILITRDTSDGITHAGVLPRLIKALKMRGTITHDVCRYLLRDTRSIGITNFRGRVADIDVCDSCQRLMILWLWKLSGWEYVRSITQVYIEGLVS